MDKNVECRNQVTESSDLLIAVKTQSLLSDLERDFEALRKYVGNYIPDYAVKHEQVYSLGDICKLYSTCENIIKNINKLGEPDSYLDHVNMSDGVERYLTLVPLQWCINRKAFSIEDRQFLYDYVERFNYFSHLLHATRTLNVDVHNAIHTVFKTSDGRSFDKVYGIIHRGHALADEFVNKRYLAIFSPELPDYYVRWDAYTDYFSLASYARSDMKSFLKFYNEWAEHHKSEIKFHSWLEKELNIRSRLDDKMQFKSDPEFNDLWGNYSAFFYLVNDEEKYEKLFEDWKDNHRSNGITFEAFLIENGYFLGNKKSEHKKKIRMNTKPKARK